MDGRGRAQSPPEGGGWRFAAVHGVGGGSRRPVAAAASGGLCGVLALSGRFGGGIGHGAVNTAISGMSRNPHRWDLHGVQVPVLSVHRKSHRNWPVLIEGNHVMKTPTVLRNVRMATEAEVAQAKIDYPNRAKLIESGTYYVGFYSDEPAREYFVVETYHNDPYHWTSCGWFNARTKDEFPTLEECVARCRELKNVRRRIVRMVKTNRWVGSDESGWGCAENGYKNLGVVGAIDWNGKKWTYTGVLARS